MPAKPVSARVSVDPAGVAGIDFLRGTFAFLVVVAHGIAGAFDPVALSAHSPVLAATLGVGGFSVRGFFVLSGFCINLSVINAVASGSYTVKSYALARISRIYPLYLIGLFAALGVWWVNHLLLPGTDPLGGHYDWTSFLGQFVMTQGLLTHSVLFYGISWTLTSEIAYYLVWPCAIKFFGGPGAKAAVGAVVATLILVLSIVVAWKVLAGGAKDSWIIPFWTVPAGGVMWLGGAWLAGCWNRLRVSRALPTLRWLAWVAVPGAYALQAVVTARQSSAAVTWAAQYACIPAYLLLIIGFQGLPSPSEKVRRFCRYLGELSYPLYILHSPTIGLVNILLGYFGLHYSGWTQVAIAVVASLLVGCLLGIPLELAIMRWRKGLLRAHHLKNPLEPLLEPTSRLTPL